MFFEKTVRAICSASAEQWQKRPYVSQDKIQGEITRFVLRQQTDMAGYLRVPLQVLTVFFGLLGVLKWGAPFHGLPAHLRARQLNAWRQSSIAVCRDLIRFYDVLIGMAIQSESSLTAVLDEHCPRERQQRGQALAPSHIFCEVAVVGSGPGGSVTACSLAEAGRKVVLLEEGRDFGFQSYDPFSIEELSAKYRNGGMTLTIGTKVPYAEGRCVGGGSEINSGIYHRTPPEILESWQREFQVEALNERDLASCFEACEKELAISLTPARVPSAALKLQEGSSKLGWESHEVPRMVAYERNDRSSQGFEVRRQSMSRTFVRRAMGAECHLIPETRVTTLRQQGSKWLVHAQAATGASLIVEAENVFLCGGAVQTPAILRRSGIQKNIGNSLQMHPMLKVAAKFNETVNSRDMGVPSYQIREFSPSLTMGCSVSSPPYLAVGLADYVDHRLEIKDEWQKMAVYYASIRAEGRGMVRSLPGFKDPVVTYRLSRRDLSALTAGLQKLCRVLLEAGAISLFPSLRKTKPVSTWRDLAALPQTLPLSSANLMTIHLFSSCPMGENRKTCATDSFGRLHGFKNLFIGDASLLCSAPGVNPQGSIMAIARRNAQHFLREL